MRGLVFAAASFVGGALLGVGKIAPSWAVLILFVASALTLARPTDAKRALGMLVLNGAMAFLLGAILGRAPPAPNLMPGTYRVRATVKGTSTDARGPVALLAASSLEHLEGHTTWKGGFLLRVHDMKAVPGTEVGAVVRVFAHERYANPSPHPEWTVTSDIDAEATLVSAAILGNAKGAWVERARAFVRTRLERTLSPDAFRVATALVLGDGSALDAERRASIRAAGLSHVIAVSGMHVTVVVVLLMALAQGFLRLFPWAMARGDVSRGLAAAFVPLCLLVAAFAGGAPSAWRAALVGAAHYGLRALGRRASALGLVAFTVLVFGAVSGADTARPAFLLSVASTVAILSTKLPRANGAIDWLRFATTISVRTTLATMPIALWCFGYVPLIGVTANLIAVPFASFALIPLGFVHAATASLGVLDGVTGALFENACGAFVSLADIFGALPSPNVPPLSVHQGVGVLVFVVGLLFLRRRTRAVVVAAGIGLIVFGEVHVRATEAPTGELRVTFLDVGQGDSALVDLPDGRLMLVDAGPIAGAEHDYEKHPLLELLRARRRSSIDVAVITHGHPDHYEGLRTLLGRIRVRELWTSSQAADEEPKSAFAQLVALARHRGISVRTEADLCGAPRHAGAATFRVVAPCPRYDAANELNDNSLVLRVDYEGRSVLFAGDVETAAETELASRPLAVRADVLKVPHHGSRTSSTSLFLRAVSPELALASAGCMNRFGHPHAEVVERYARAGIALTSTNLDGGCIVTIANGKIERECALTGEHASGGALGQRSVRAVSEVSSKP